MASIIGIRVEEAYVGFEMSITEIKLLLEAFNHSEISVDSNKPEQVKYQKKYYEFYELLKGTLEGTAGDIERANS